VITDLAKTSAEESLGVLLPHRRMEEWRWTDVRARLNKPYPPQIVSADAKDVARMLAASPFDKIAKLRVVFLNGVMDEKLSHTIGVDISKSSTQTLKLTDPLLALNIALKPNGATLRFAGEAEQLVELIHITTKAAPRALAIRHRIEVADGASASILETYLGEGDYVMNAVTEISIGKNAKLNRVKLERESHEATHLSHVIYDLDEKSQLQDTTITSGAALNRQNGNCNFNGEYADAKINGAYLLNNKQHADTRLVINHAVPHGTSRETFKCVMDDHARGIFQGKVIVAKHAQKTDGKQSSHALLLSENAEFDAKPELEIYADDVVCGHGATAGDLNEDHLFYLKSRGIPQAEAKSLLIAAFVGEVFDSIEHEGLRGVLVGIADAWLHHA
jgi:Fe-S cluster assembly protein SufD